MRKKEKYQASDLPDEPYDKSREVRSADGISAFIRNERNSQRTYTQRERESQRTYRERTPSIQFTSRYRSRSRDGGRACRLTRSTRGAGNRKTRRFR